MTTANPFNMTISQLLWTRDKAGATYTKLVDALFAAIVDLTAAEHALKSPAAERQVWPEGRHPSDIREFGAHQRGLFQSLAEILEHPEFAPRRPRRLIEQIERLTAAYTDALPRPQTFLTQTAKDEPNVETI